MRAGWAVVFGALCISCGGGGGAVPVAFPSAPDQEPDEEPTEAPAPEEADLCDGLLPRSLGASVSVVVPGIASKRYCGSTTSDATGNVLVDVYGMGPNASNVFSPDGTATTTFWSNQAARAISHGFQAVTSSPSISHPLRVTTWAPDGSKTNEVAIPDPMAFHFPAETGGTVVVGTDSWGCPNGAGGRSTLNVYRFDDSGARRSAVDLGGTGCPIDSTGGVAAVSDARNNTLVVVQTGWAGAFGMPARRVIARWVSADGKALTDWFDVGEEGSRVRAYALIGGGAAVRIGSEWRAAVPSGAAASSSVPSFLTSAPGTALHILGGGRGYATYSTDMWDGELNVFAPSGEHCGMLHLGDQTQVSVGKDDTVITLTGDSTGQCIADWWPHLLRE